MLLRVRRVSSSPTASAAAEQIAQGTGRQLLHLAEVLQMALQPSALDIDDPYPESRTIRDEQNEVTASMKRAALAVGAVAAGAALLGAQPAKANRNPIPCFSFVDLSVLRGPCLCRAIAASSMAQRPGFWDNVTEAQPWFTVA